MKRETRVCVFESENIQEIQLVKTKLEEAKIDYWVNNGYMSFTTTPTANTLRIMVDLNNEKQAFDIIDNWLQENELNNTIS